MLRLLTRSPSNEHRRYYRCCSEKYMMNVPADTPTRNEQSAETNELSLAKESIVVGKQDDEENTPVEEPDVVVPREERPVGRFKHFVHKLLPVLDRPPAEREQWPRRRRQSITDELPWVEYLPDVQQIAFADDKTVMACYELTPVATEGRSLPMLRRIVQDIVPLLDNVIPEEKHDPWILGFYGNMDHAIDGVVDKMRNYAHERASGSAYTEDYLARMEEHYHDVTREGGYFHDDVVTDTAWGGKTQRVRLVLYRQYSRTKPVDDTSDELEIICNKLENVLRSMRIDAERLNGRGFYRWMRNWLNPKPAMCGGDPSKLDKIAPYPGDLGGEEGLPIGYDIAEAVTLTRPVIDDKTGVWYLDNMPHVVLQTESVVSVPKPGALTGEVERDRLRYTTIDQLPEGTVIALNIIFKPREETLGDIEVVRDSARGSSEGARATRSEAKTILEHQEHTQEPLYPCELAFYLRADNMSLLRESVSDAQATLQRAGIKTYDPFMQDDPVRVGNFTRNLPGVMKASIDERAARRARLVHANHIIRLAPIFGRSRGTGNPGIAMFNRSGEPMFIDLLSEKDSQLNGHTFIYGTSGSGKSAGNVAMLDSIIAMHRPRIFILDLGNSFGPFAEHAKSLGVSTHVLQLNMTTDVSMPPFADALQLVGKQIDLDAKSVQSEETLEEDITVFEKGGVDNPDVKLDRDILGELEIIARQMIAGGGGVPVESATMKIAIQRAIKKAAEKAAKGELESSVPRPEDIAACLSDIGRLPENATREQEIEELANAMRLFCSGLNGHLFNRDGNPLPEVDLTVLDMADAGQSGRSETLIIAVISLVMHINRIAERDQYTGRPILFLIDEGHMITSEELLMTLLIKITKMWRKLGARLWLATQEIDDIPAAVKRMIGMMEYWIAMSMPPQQIELTRQFRTIHDEQASMMAQCRINKGKYAEGCILTRDSVMQFRSVPPSKTFALSQTSPGEKANRFAMMEKHGISENEAITLVGEEIRKSRLAARPMKNTRGRKG